MYLFRSTNFLANNNNIISSLKCSAKILGSLSYENLDMKMTQFQLQALKSTQIQRIWKMWVEEINVPRTCYEKHDQGNRCFRTLLYFLF